MAGFTIRHACADDALQCAELINAIIEEGKYTALTEPFTVDSMQGLIERCASHGTFLVAVALPADGDITAPIGLRPLPPEPSPSSLRSQTSPLRGEETAGGDLLGIQLVLPLSDLAAFAHVGDIGTYVSSTSHRSGVGRALAEATFKTAKEKGFTKIMAFIRADNPRAQSFYKSIGFDQIGIAHRQARVRDQFIDEVLMERFL